MKNNKSSQNWDTGNHNIKYGGGGGGALPPCKYIILRIIFIEEQTNL